MAMLKQNTSALCCFVAALMVVMAATFLLSSCDARKQVSQLNLLYIICSVAVVEIGSWSTCFSD